MPAPNAKTEAIERIRLLLAALTADWQDRDALIERVGVYPDAEMSARAMLRADMRALLALGFQVERTEGHHDPQWRILGHVRFGAEVRVKFCSRCKQWRGLDTDFPRDAAQVSGVAVYCNYCNRARVADWKAAYPEKQQAWRRKFPERVRAIHQRYNEKRRRARKKDNDELV